jgi:hypothetical protein
MRNRRKIPLPQEFGPGSDAVIGMHPKYDGLSK